MIKRIILTALISGALFLTAGEKAGAAAVPDSAKPATKSAPAAPAPQEESAMVLKPKIATYDYDAIPKDPLASLLMSLTIPGSGQLYNREFSRGIPTMVVFYGSALTFALLLDKWTRLNTDTFYIAETNQNGVPTGYVRQVYAMKPNDQQVGLSRGGKVLFVSSIVLGVASYAFGIFDSYIGAKRYNKKLLENQQIKFGLTADPLDKKVGVSANLRF
jgi:TM2 domain-containing membrane protein YozV